MSLKIEQLMKEKEQIKNKMDNMKREKNLALPPKVQFKLQVNKKLVKI